jgi:hypothetical protein
MALAYVQEEQQQEEGEAPLGQHCEAVVRAQLRTAVAASIPFAGARLRGHHRRARRVAHARAHRHTELVFKRSDRAAFS